MYVIEIQGLDRLRATLRRDITPELGALTLGLAEEAKGIIQEYPPATEANRPKTEWKKGGPNTWYQRGYGPWWIRKDNTVKSAKTSQDLGSRWFTEPAGPTAARAVNRSTYAPYVHSSADQAEFHKARGWKTDKDTVEEMKRSGVIERMVRDMVRRWLGR